LANSVYPPTRGWSAVVPAAFFLVLIAATPARAQKTDVITLANGDRITGEIKALERGRVEFSTDDMGTIYLEWDKLVSITSVNLFDVGTSDGRRFLGRLGAAPERSLSVLSVLESVTLEMWRVTEIRPIGASFWQRLDGSIDVGFNYTRSSEIAQLNLNSVTIFRRPSFEARLNASGTVTWTDDEENGEEDRDDRGTVRVSYFRYRGARAFVGGAVAFETNDSLGLELRSQATGVAGLRWVNSNRAQVATSAGLSVNDERGVDTAATQNLEAIMSALLSYFTYDRPKTNLDLSFSYYPSLSDFGRQRLQFDGTIKREVLKDLFLSLNVFDTFDSRPPNEQSQRNDVGIVFSFGWSY
jgi:hypothetical protein